MRRGQRVSPICGGIRTNAAGTHPDVRQRGFTLLEVLIVTGIVAIIAAAAIAAAAQVRPFAARSAAIQLQAALTYARSLASADEDGSTIAVTPNTDASGDVLPGFVVRVYRGRPDRAGALKAAPVPQFIFSADIFETSLGAPPFIVFFDGAGHASGVSGNLMPGMVLAADPGCRMAAALTFRLSDGRSNATLTAPCARGVAGAPSTPSPLGN